MISLVSSNPLVRQIAEETADMEIKELFIAKNLPLSEEEYLEAGIFLLKETKIQKEALALIQKIGSNIKERYVERKEANPRVIYFILREALASKEMKIISKIIHNQAVPPEFLSKIAETGTPEMLENLLDNQIKLIAFPEILTSMEKNPQINKFIQGKIKEIREFYLSESKPEVTTDPSPSTTSAEAQTDSEKTEITADSGDEVLEIEKISILEKLKRLSLSDKVKLALTGSKTERMMLLYDNSRMVAYAVLESPKISEEEIVLAAQNKSISSDIIARICKNKVWKKNYRIMLELVHNPKTPMTDALRLATQLHEHDMRMIIRDKNVNPTIRNFVMEYYRQKIEKKEKRG